jgi:hypothetical protein
MFRTSSRLLHKSVLLPTFRSYMLPPASGLLVPCFLFFSIRTAFLVQTARSHKALDLRACLHGECPVLHPAQSLIPGPLLPVSGTVGNKGRAIWVLASPPPLPSAARMEFDGIWRVMMDFPRGCLYQLLRSFLRMEYGIAWALKRLAAARTSRLQFPARVQIILVLYHVASAERPRGSLLVKALGYKPEGRGF